MKNRNSAAYTGKCVLLVSAYFAAPEHYITMFLNATQNENFADLQPTFSAWAALLGFIGILLAIDLYRHRHNSEPTFKTALKESVAWISIALLFTFVILKVYGTQAGSEYFSGLLIEKSLSVDNVFVWAVIFDKFRTPLRYQHRVLFWGILGALVLRAIFILVGSAILAAAWWTMLLFGGFLIVTGVKVLRHTKDEGEREHDGVIKIMKRFVPVTEELDGHKFISKINGKRVATGLMACLIVVEFTDVIFAIDSVPAVLAVSREPYIVFASNAFAILGLRALYFLLAGAKEKLHYLAHALGVILIFVGVKMFVGHWVHVPTSIGLGFIALSLAVATIMSLRKERNLNPR